VDHQRGWGIFTGGTAAPRHFGSHGHNVGKN
jgi:hypothetical protein